MHLFKTLLLSCSLLPYSYCKHQQHHEPNLRQLEPQVLSEVRGYWERLLEDAEGSMDTGDNTDGTQVEGMVIVPSLFSFSDTYDNLVSALNVAPVNIVSEISHSDAAVSVDLELAPNKVVVFGNPNLGTPLMIENRQSGIDLPQKMLVWEDENGEVFVGYNCVQYLEFRFDGIDAAETQLETIAGALLNFASAASGIPKEEIQVEEDVNLKSTGIITETSDADFVTTWERLLEAISQSPANVVFTVDHSANAKSVGHELPPTRLVVFGNPLLGTPLMKVSPTAGIDLPLKILVWQDENGLVQVTTNEISFIETRHKIKGADEALDRITAAVGNFMAAATGAS